MINPIHNIDNIYVSSEGEPVDLQGVTLSEETLLAYEDALDPDLSLGRRIRRFLTAQNGAGRWAKVIKDAFLIFVPYGRQINTITDFITDRLQPQQNKTVMDKPKLKSKTIQGILVLLLTVILQAFGVDVTGNPEIMENIYHILYGLSGFWSVYGLRDALGRIITKQEDG